MISTEFEATVNLKQEPIWNESKALFQQIQPEISGVLIKK